MSRSLDSVIEHLSARRTLLVLDNFEHVSEQAPPSTGSCPEHVT